MSYKKEKEYICGWCLHKFKAIAGTMIRNSNLKGRSKRGSNTITCSKCGNNIKTWADREERELLIISQGR